MYDCAEDVLGYHDDEVTLPDAERKTMRERRNTNRVQRQHLWDRLRVFTNGGWLVHRSP